jgi:hypothetical protein
MITVLALVVRWTRADRAESRGDAVTWRDPRWTTDEPAYPALGQVHVPGGDS